MERLIIVIAATTSTAADTEAQMFLHATDWEAVGILCPGLGGLESMTRSANHAPWDHDEMQAWFLARSGAVPDDLVPNLVAVNFYRRGDLFRVVDAINGVG